MQLCRVIKGSETKTSTTLKHLRIAENIRELRSIFAEVRRIYSRSNNETCRRIFDATEY